MKNRPRDYLPILFFLFFAVIAYWQIGFLQDTLKWDALDAFLPWRRAVADSLRSGHLPFWNPYQYLGFPLHSDPECGAWYPVLWVFALFRDYDFYSLNLEFCFHIFIAGYGTFQLARSLNLSTVSSILAGISFMCCGFFVGNAQNFIFLIGVAWFPWTFLYLRRALLFNQVRDAIITAFFLYLILSGSYPGITIITVYCLAAYVIYFLISYRKRFKDGIALSGTIRSLTLLLVSALVFSAVVLVSTSEAMPYFSRAGAISFDLISENPFPPKAFISLLLPYATTVGTMDFWGSGITMLNGYAGLVPLVLILAWMFSPGKTRRELTLFTSSLLLFSIAMGAYLPLRFLLYKILPGMDLFRHPAIFRPFALLAFILTACSFLDRLPLMDLSGLRKFKWSGGVILLTCLACVILKFPVHPKHVIATVFREYFHFPIHSDLTVGDHVFLQALLQFILLAFLLLLIRKKPRLEWILLFAAVDMWAAVQLNANATINLATASDPMFKRESDFKLLTSKPVAYDNRTIAENEPGKLGFRTEGLWRNLNMLGKQPYFEGYNSFQFTNFNRYELSGFYRHGLQNRLIYLSDSCYAQSLMEDSIHKPYRNTNLYSEDVILPDHRKVREFGGRLNKGDTIKDISILPNGIEGRVQLKEPAIVTLIQNYHHNWKVMVDGKERKGVLFVTNHTLMSFVLEGGEHVVKYVYEPTRSYLAFLVSSIGMGITLVVLVFQKRSSSS